MPSEYEQPESLDQGRGITTVWQRAFHSVSASAPQESEQLDQHATLWRRAKRVSYAAVEADHPGDAVPLWQRAKRRVSGATSRAVSGVSQRGGSGLSMIQQLVASAQNSQVVTAQQPLLAALAKVTKSTSSGRHITSSHPCMLQNCVYQLTQLCGLKPWFCCHRVALSVGM